MSFKVAPIENQKQAKVHTLQENTQNGLKKILTAIVEEDDTVTLGGLGEDLP